MRGAHAIGKIPADTGPPDLVILADTSAWVEYDRATGSRRRPAPRGSDQQ